MAVTRSSRRAPSGAIPACPPVPPSACPQAVSVLAVLILAALLLTGCAGTAPQGFAEEPGVPVRIELESGESFSGEMIGVERGAVIIDHSVPKSQYVSVVRRDGVDVVFIDGVPVGTAMEVRGVDILMRERLDFFEIERIDVVSRAYFGWGSGIAAGLAFFLVQVLEDLEI